MNGRFPVGPALKFIGMGWYIAASIVLGALGGVWLDRVVGTSPIFLLIGLLLGIITAFYGTYRMIAVFLMGERNNKGNGGRGS